MYSLITTNMTLDMQECDMIRKELDDKLNTLKHRKERYGEKHAIELLPYERLINKITKAQHRMVDDKITSFDVITNMDKGRLADFLTNISCTACGKRCDKCNELKQSYIEFLDKEETEGAVGVFEFNCKVGENNETTN